MLNGLYVKEIENIINLTTHSSTKYTPYEVQYGKNPQFKISQLINFPPNEQDNTILYVKVKENLLQNAEIRKTQQKKCSKTRLEVNDLVLIRSSKLSNALDKMTKKFFQLYGGPYKIAKIISQNAYRSAT